MTNLGSMQFAVGTKVLTLGQRLYAPTKTGNVKVWSAHVIGCDTSPVATIQIISQTKLGGKEVIREDVITEGKNIGKSNETTPFRQAISEAESRYRKKMDQGYKTEIPTDTSKANDNALGLPKPMLAHPIDKVKKVEFPAHWQPKLDGHRAVVTKQNGEMMMYSRQGKPITTMAHILSHLEDKVGEGEFIDGELYLHGEMLQNIGALIKKYRAGTSEHIVYHVYDTMMDVPYTQRIAKLRIMLNDEEPTSPVQLVTTMLVENIEQAHVLTQRVIDEGYEGGILRTPDNGYEVGFRSRTLLKIKKFDDSEHTIIDVVEGNDRIVNGEFFKVACFICQTPDGKTFEVTSMGNMYEKDRTWHERDKFVGKTVTIKHSGYTKDGIPWHPVAMRLREDI
jgi:DNA ligase-1